MTAALKRLEESPSPADIIGDLRQARARRDETLRLAVDCAGGEIAPAVIELVERAASCGTLSTEGRNLVFWGIHVLAAARQRELFQPLMRLVTQCPDDALEEVLEDAISDTLPRILISVFDGDACTLIEACADRKVEGGVRWAMIGALARLTFDGSVARETTLAFLDRFDRESLAEPDDLAWQGWLDAIYLLGVEEMRERPRVASQEDRFFEYEDELDEWEKRLTLARSLAPGDASLFEKVDYKPINDVVQAVKQFSYREYGDERDDGGEREDEDEEDDDDEHENDDDEDEDDEDDDDYSEHRQEKATFDPAWAIALKQDEIDWLASFLKSDGLPSDAMTVEEIDGFFCALAIEPDRVKARRLMPLIYRSAATSPFKTHDAGPRVGELIVRMWNTILDRLDAGVAHRPLLLPSAKPRAQLWAKAFFEGMERLDSDWVERVDSEDEMVALAGPIADLGFDDGEEHESSRMTAERRAECVAALPGSILGLYGRARFAAARERSREALQSVRNTKIGRNEPCPCGSEKKYKRCCGSVEMRALK